MKTALVKYLTTALVALAAYGVMANSANAQEAQYERSLREGAREDVTPQQKYRSAIREAGGALKESMRDCNTMPGADRTNCAREAKATYERDMAEARALLRGAPVPSSR